MITLQPPTSQLASVLAAMIQYEGISERDTHFNGFRTRISQLHNQYNLPIKKKMVSFVNQFGRVSQYSFHFLEQENKELAVEVYNRINKIKL